MTRFDSLLPILTAAVLAGGPLAARSETPMPMVDPVEEIRLEHGELPVVTLTRDLLYRILVAEFAAQRGDYEQAGHTFMRLARDTSDPRLAKRAFQAAMASHDLALAYQAARQWAVLDPEDPEAVASSLALAATSGQTTGLASALAKRIREADDPTQAIIQASAIVGKMQDKRIAFEVLEKAIPQDALDLPVARMALADTAWDALDAYRALKEARKALSLDPDSEPAAQRVLEYGLDLEPAVVLNDTQRWLQAHPDARKLQLMLVSRLVERRDYAGALQHIRRLRQQAPEDFDLLYTEAEIEVQAEHYDNAKRLLEEYISVQTQRRQSLDDQTTNALADTSDARLLLVRIAEKQNDLAQAIRELGRIDEPSLQFQAQVHKAVLLGRQGNLDEARRTLEGLPKRDDRERAVAALTMASIYREAGRTDKAVDLLYKADRELPNTPELKYDLAMLYERQGRMDEFEALMREVIELAPENANAYNALGYTYADQNRRLDEARILLEQALDLDPNNPYILDSIGWYFFRIDDLEAAIEYLQRSYDALPEAEVAAHLGEALWASGRRDEALQVWRAGHQQDADNDTLQETLQRLGVRLE